MNREASLPLEELQSTRFSISQEEAPFAFEELFFSRTDSRGIILSGNSVFQRISLYNWDELLKKPHNLIRHPDMPKGVFYLFWNFLKQGKPIGAYVKNRSKDGKYYWVFAVATPIEGGYLSLRLKPSSDFFNTIKEEYKSLLSYEREHKVSPKESAARLLEDLKTLGFDSYEAFMSVAIRKEIAGRDQQLGLRKDVITECFEELSEKASALIKETGTIFSSYELNKYVPLNLQVQSFRLGDEGKTIGVISGNYNIVSTEIRNEIATFSQSAQDVFNKIYEGQFLLGTARLQGEVIEFFKKEEPNDFIARDQEMAFLQAQQKEYREKATQGLRNIATNIETFQEDCRRMRRCASSLEVIRVMGKVDSARVSVTNGGLNELINDLKLFQSAIAESLAKIEQYNSGMRFSSQRAIASLKKN